MSHKDLTIIQQALCGAGLPSTDLSTQASDIFKTVTGLEEEFSLDSASIALFLRGARTTHVRTKTLQRNYNYQYRVQYPSWSTGDVIFTATITYDRDIEVVTDYAISASTTNVDDFLPVSPLSDVTSVPFDIPLGWPSLTSATDKLVTTRGLASLRWTANTLTFEVTAAEGFQEGYYYRDSYPSAMFPIGNILVIFKVAGPDNADYSSDGLTLRSTSEPTGSDKVGYVTHYYYARDEELVDIPYDVKANSVIIGAPRSYYGEILALTSAGNSPASTTKPGFGLFGLADSNIDAEVQIS